MAASAKPKTRREPLEDRRIDQALRRLARERALNTLVQGALPTPTLKRLLKDAFPKSITRELPVEVWGSLAVGIALEAPAFAFPLCDELHDRLGWDREPEEMDDWWRAVRERPLEALWMAAVSDSKEIKREFAHIAQHCLDNFRSSPECRQPSWEYLEGVLDVQARTAQDLKDAERKAEDAERRLEAERQRLDDLRDELRRLRRENAELRGQVAAERRRESVEPRPAAHGDDPRLEETERRLRKAEKENEHLRRELERRTAPPPAPGAEPEDLGGDETDPAEAAQAVSSGAPPPSQDPLPRRRVLRQMLRKLFKKGKVGASHTHEDNVYRGLADHEKGMAKEAMDLLYREGIFMPKPTVADPHVSIAPERVAEVQAIVAGEIDNARLRRFVEG